jgi:hypothetical protein
MTVRENITFKSYGFNFTNSARTSPASIISFPKLTGKSKRLGPALPGLK